MSYHPRSKSLTRACWRDGRGALRCKRPGMQFSGFGADSLVLPGAPTAKPAAVTDTDFLIAQLNRFKEATGVPAGQQLGTVKFPFGMGINDSMAIDALTVVGRRLTGSVAVIGDPGARQLLADVRAILGAGDASGLGSAVAYVTKNALPMGQQIAAFGDSLGLLTPSYPTTIGGLSGLKLFVAAGTVGAVALFFMIRRTP
jgi:hypothetical protein